MNQVNHCDVWFKYQAVARETQVQIPTMSLNLLNDHGPVTLSVKPTSQGSDEGRREDRAMYDIMIPLEERQDDNEIKSTDILGHWIFNLMNMSKP